MSLQYIREKPEPVKESIKILSVYVKDIFNALWHDEVCMYKCNINYKIILMLLIINKIICFNTLMLGISCIHIFTDTSY